MRIAILLPVVVLALACKKQPKEDPDPGPPPGPPKVGHSITKIPGEGDGSAEPAGSAAPGASGGTTGSAAAAGSAAPVPPDARPVGGNGKAAYRDDAGHVHGPGGPVYMGNGATCDDAHDHCMRPGVWFSVANFIPGKMFRALPLYELEGKWFDWRGEEATPVKAYRTELAGNKTIPAGAQVIWFSTEASEPKFPESEYEALTSSRWEAGVADAASSNGSVRIKGWGSATTNTVRLVVESK